jgi:hypothetical protein
VYHQERASPYAHPARFTDELIVKPQGVPDLQPSILQRIAESSEGYPSSRAGKGEEGDAVSWVAGQRPGTGLEDERLAPAGHHGGPEANPLGGEHDVRDGEEGAEPPSGGAEEVYRGRPSIPDGQDCQVTIHLILSNWIALQQGSAFLDFPYLHLSQRIQVPDDEIRDHAGLQGVPGPAVRGHYQVRSSGDAPEQIWRVRGAVQEDGGPHARTSSPAGT